jgi:hypothetical protein
MKKIEKAELLKANIAGGCCKSPAKGGNGGGGI